MKTKNINFYLVGCAGYIAKRHIEVIFKLKNSKLIAVFDPSPNVGFLDNFSYDINYFSKFFLFEKFIDSSYDKYLKNYLIICSPNYTHISYIKFGLKKNFTVICEKPLCISANDIRYLNSLKPKFKNKIHTILQLRYSKNIHKIKKYFIKNKNSKIIKSVNLKYITPRGNWYFNTWKGNKRLSGGILFNIGIHLFDFLIFIFGKPINCGVFSLSKYKSSGFIGFDGYKINWILSLKKDDLNSKIKSLREISYKNKSFEFSDRFEDLHYSAYKEILNSSNSNLNETLKSIDLVYKMTNKQI